MEYRSSRAVWMFRVVVSAATVLFPLATHAQQSPFTFLHKFYSGPRVPSGRLVEMPDGSLFGTTACGGEPDTSCQGGSIFALRPQADGTWRYETLHNLRPGLEGSNPVSGLTLARDGSLFGIASNGGLPRAQAWGTIFRVNPSGSIAPVYVFANHDSLRVDESPIGRVAEASDGNLYGSTCLQGGTGPQSRMFRVTPSGSFATTYSFPRSTTEPVVAPNGMCPVTQLHEASDGFLYGTTVAGGPAVSPFFPPQGTLFRIDPRAASPSVSVLHTFRGFEGAVPTGGLAAGSSGEYFGTTAAGGLFGQGVVFRRDPSGTVQTLHAFSGGDGATPSGGLFRSPDGALYGTTLRGGIGHGTVFRAGAAGVARLHAFSGEDGSIPIEVMRARDGDLYGVTALGGPGGGGTVFRVGADDALSTVHVFYPGARGPDTGVIQGSDGNFYGTTAGGGRGGGGTVFRLTPAGQLTILHEFAPRSPSLAFEQSIGATRLVQGTDGFLYGRTAGGGVQDRGTIYRISTAGAFTLLHEFTGSGGYAGGFEDLIQASDGDFYGLTSANSAAAATLFKFDASGTFSTVYTFGEPGGLSPIGPLAEGPDGALYGVAYGAGAFNLGGLYKITKSGTFTVLYSFDGVSSIGYRPVSGLVRAADGGFYGVTTFSGIGGPSIYHLDPATNVVTRVSGLPLSNDATVMEAGDGALYGWVTVPTFPKDVIRFFRFADGAFEFYYDPAEGDGYRPGRLIQSSDGALYGTMAEGPSRYLEPETWPADVFAGGVFRLALPPRK